jgi:hypothetical protein
MKKIKYAILILLLTISSFRTYTFISNLQEIQSHKYEVLEENYLITHDLIANFFNSLESSLTKMDMVKNLSDFESNSSYILNIIHFDKNYKFISGFERGSYLDIKGKILDAFTLPRELSLNNSSSGWIYVNLNPQNYTATAFYLLKQDSGDIYLAKVSLVPAIRKIYTVCYGVQSFAFVKNVEKNEVLEKFYYSTPTIFDRFLNKPIYFEALLVENWALVFNGLWEDVYPYSLDDLNAIYVIILLYCLTFTLLTSIVLKSSFQHAKSFWAPSIVFNIFCLGSIVFLYLDLPEKYRIITERTNSYQNSLVNEIKDRQLIATSFYIESLSFPDDSSCFISGFISQLYPKEFASKAGYIFPDESVIYQTSIEEVSRIETNNYIAILTHFSVCLAETYSSSFFPFDSRNISLIIRPLDLSDKFLFFPNFANYFPYVKDIEIIDQNVEPSGWKFSSSDYLMTPESVFEFFGLNISGLTFKLNLILERNFLGAFLSNILILTLCILFSFLILFIPIDSLLNSLFASLSIFVGLIFVAVTNHASIRGNLSTSSYAFIEYLFISYYLLILAITIDFIYRVYKPNIEPNFLIFRRIMFFPTLLASFSIILAYSIF